MTIAFLAGATFGVLLMSTLTVWHRAYAETIHQEGIRNWMEGERLKLEGLADKASAERLFEDYLYGECD